MPTFSIVTAREARESNVSAKRTELLQEYIGYIQRVGAGQAGMLTAGERETTQALRRRLNAAAEALGRSLEVRRTRNSVYFWEAGGAPSRQAAQGSC